MKYLCSSRFYHTLWGKILVFGMTMVLLSLTVFFISRMAPGDPLQSFYGERIEQMSDTEQTAARQRLGLDRPIYIQYCIWMNHAIHGEFGISYKYKEPAAAVVGARIGNTLFLGIVSYVLVFLTAIVLALCCARYEDRWLDTCICKIGTISCYLPSFWVGLILILVCNVNLGWLPGSGAYDPGHSDDIFNRLAHIVLPTAVIMIGHVWYYAYMIRNALLQETRQEYVLLAKSKGLSRWQILCRHCLRSTVPVIVSIMSISVNHILGGAYVVEAVFSYPGIGNLAIESAKYHDYNLLMLIVLITGAVVVAAGLVAQAVNEHIDPRMKVTEGESLWKINPPSVS